MITLHVQINIQMHRLFLKTGYVNSCSAIAYSTVGRGWSKLCQKPVPKPNCTFVPKKNGHINNCNVNHPFWKARHLFYIFNLLKPLKEVI